MQEYQQIFRRYETKYLLSKRQYHQILCEMEKSLKPDLHGLHTVSNIYYDTADFQMIRTSLEKPLYKEKLRLRCYGIPKSEDAVFMEIKKKYKGIVYKRRIMLPLIEAEASLQARNFTNSHEQQIAQELSWMLQKYQPEAKVVLSYDRSAYQGIEDPELRITFDQDIRFRQSIFDLSKGSWGHPLLPADQILMEIKIPGAMPLWLCELLNHNSIYPASFSKYGYCYQNYLGKFSKFQGGAHCA